MACPMHGDGSTAPSQGGADAGACPMHGGRPGTASEAPQQPGQAVFGALREVLERLEADSATDWSRVDLDALRQHLVEMDLLFRDAKVAREALADGMRYVVTGSPEVVAAAGRMGTMHAGMLAAERPAWRVVVEQRLADVVFEVRSSDPEQQAKIRGIGFFGMLATGAHHGPHHLALAAGRTMEHAHH
jgi:hypothetical protein